MADAGWGSLRTRGPRGRSRTAAGPTNLVHEAVAAVSYPLAAAGLADRHAGLVDAEAGFLCEGVGGCQTRRSDTSTGP